MREGPERPLGSAADFWWLDGRVVAELPPLRAGCYTTGRYTSGQIRHAESLADALVRDAHDLVGGELDRGTCLDALRQIGEKCFGESGGVVRLDVALGVDGILHLVGRGRPLGPETNAWRAVLHSEIHPGPRPPLGVKRARDTVLLEASERAERFGVEEALLIGPGGDVVEGALTNVFVRTGEGHFLTPPIEAGAVRGVARELLLQSFPDIREAPVRVSQLRAAREVIVTDAVHGAIAVIRVDGAFVGNGQPGPGAKRMAALLDAHA